MTDQYQLPSTIPYVIIPTYEEAENIELIVRRILQEVPLAQVVVVDDSSPDGTGEIVLKLKESGLTVDLIARSKKSGLGSAYRAGFTYALSKGASACVEIDADLSHDPAVIPSLLLALDEGADLAIGSRYVSGGSSPGLSRGRLLISRGGNLYASLTLGVPAKDSTAGFRAFRRSALEEINLETVRADGYGFQVEMAYLVHSNGGKIVEIPITFRDRVAGGSKMSSRIVLEAMLLCTMWGLARKIPFFGRQEFQTSVLSKFGKGYQIADKTVKYIKTTKS